MHPIHRLYSSEFDLPFYHGDRTSKTPGFNNPGYIDYNNWSINHGATGDSSGFATFDTEQDGRQALGDLIDANYADYTDSSFVTKFVEDSAGQANEQNIVDSYMQSYGYGTYDTMGSMDDNEFNTFLDAITKA